MCHSNSQVMANEKLENLDDKQLKKRKKFLFFIIGICIGLLIVMGVLIGIGKENTSSLLPVGLALIVVIMPLTLVIKKNRNLPILPETIQK